MYGSELTAGNVPLTFMRLPDKYGAILGPARGALTGPHARPEQEVQTAALIERLG